MEERIPTERGNAWLSVRKSSNDRFWAGIEATLYDTSDDFEEMPLFLNHSVSMHIGAPLRATCRCDGSVHPRFQMPGDIDIVPAGFSGTWELGGPTTMLIVNLSRSLLATAAQETGADSDHLSIAPKFHVRDPQIQHICLALKAELEADEPLGRVYAESLGLALAAHLLRRYAPIVPQRLAGPQPSPRVQRAIDYIHRHLSNALTLSELAVVAGLRPTQFKLTFRQSVGIPVHQYIIRSRVAYAVNLIESDSLALRDVALQAGFANQSHMAACVRRVTGMTPGAIRNCG